MATAGQQQGLLKPLLLVLDVLCFIWLVYLLVDVSDGGQGARGALVLFWGAVALSTAFIALLAAGWFLPRRGRGPVRSFLAYWLVPPASVFLGLVICCSALSHSLFVFRFRLSRPALERYVERCWEAAASNGEIGAGWVGLLPVRETEVLPRRVGVITSACDVLNDCGVVFSPEGMPPRVGADAYRPLGEGWWFWYRKW